MRATLVVLVDELVELVLEFLEGFGWWLGGEAFLEGLVESFDFPAGGGVVGSTVLVHDSQLLEGSLEPVPASFAS